MSTAFSIPGLTEETVNNTDPTAKEGQGRPFPVTNAWQTFTGTVTKVEVKTLGEGAKANEYLSLRVRNGQCGAEILVSTEPEKTFEPKDDADHQAQYQRNLEALTKAVKGLGIFKGGKVDPALYQGGVVVAFGAKLKGYREHNGKQYPKVGTIFNGVVPVLIPVEPLAGSTAAMPDDDIPF